ncbi:hypothetical protein [Streptomyces sp. NPDC058374]
METAPPQSTHRTTQDLLGPLAEDERTPFLDLLRRVSGATGTRQGPGPRL